MGQHLGQHFLNDERIISRISDEVKIENITNLIEIGPGHGELTKYLVRKLQNNTNLKLFLLERDSSLVAHLKKKFGEFMEEGRVEIIEGNALLALPKLAKAPNFRNETYAVVGNIPYYITGFLFRTIGELEKKPIFSTFLIQKEVAERIAAEPPHMNLLAASVQYWAAPTLVLSVPKNCFTPPPKVESAVITLATKRLEPASDKVSDVSYYELIRCLFKQPRKTILNNVRLLPALHARSHEEVLSMLARAGIDPNQRPQHIHIDAIKKLASFVYNK